MPDATPGEARAAQPPARATRDTGLPATGSAVPAAAGATPQTPASNPAAAPLEDWQAAYYRVIALLGGHTAGALQAEREHAYLLAFQEIGLALHSHDPIPHITGILQRVVPGAVENPLAARGVLPPP